MLNEAEVRAEIGHRWPEHVIRNIGTNTVLLGALLYDIDDLAKAPFTLTDKQVALIAEVVSKIDVLTNPEKLADYRPVAPDATLPEMVYKTIDAALDAYFRDSSVDFNTEWGVRKGVDTLTYTYLRQRDPRFTVMLGELSDGRKVINTCPVPQIAREILQTMAQVFHE